jgi:hypothetical protein
VPEYETPIHPADFDRLMETLPTTIEGSFEIKVTDGDPAGVDLSATYDFGLAYKVVFPLAFGPDMHIIADVPDDNIGGTFSDIADIGIKASEVTIGVELETSLQIHVEGVTIALLNEEDIPVPGVTATVTGAIEGPSPSVQGSTVSTFTVGLNVDSGDLEALAPIYRLKLRLPLKGTAEEDEVIRFSPDDYFKGRAWVSIPGGVEIDPEKLLNGGGGNEQQEQGQ